MTGQTHASVGMDFSDNIRQLVPPHITLHKDGYYSHFQNLQCIEGCSLGISIDSDMSCTSRKKAVGGKIPGVRDKPDTGFTVEFCRFYHCCYIYTSEHRNSSGNVLHHSTNSFLTRTQLTQEGKAKRGTRI